MAPIKFFGKENEVDAIGAIHIVLFIVSLVAYFLLYCFFAFSLEKKFQRERRQLKANYLKLMRKSEERQRELENLTKFFGKKLGYTLPKEKNSNDSSSKIN